MIDAQLVIDMTTGCLMSCAIVMWCWSGVIDAFAVGDEGDGVGNGLLGVGWVGRNGNGLIGMWCGWDGNAL